ncbi:MAG: hypothetical protein HRU09_10960 [Oligoflexales bacterium]|nr:hypothetical protein [Oligoflexales bacterium]
MSIKRCTLEPVASMGSMLTTFGFNKNIRIDSAIAKKLKKGINGGFSKASLGLYDGLGLNILSIGNSILCCLIRISHQRKQAVRASKNPTIPGIEN